MNRAISNTDDVIDSRDIIARVTELEAERQRLITFALSMALIEGDTADRVADAELAVQEFDDGDEGVELHSLKELAEEASGSADWVYGATLINDDYFEDYARELADDIGAVKSDAGWPTMHIDWKAAAESLQQDYTQVDFDGQTFWVRA